VFKTLIDVDSLQELLGQPRLAVVDCRFDLNEPEAGRQAYLRAHIPGRYADLNRDLSAPVDLTPAASVAPAGSFAGRLGAMGIGTTPRSLPTTRPIGSIAARLWWMLRWLGHDAGGVLDGGFKAWTARGGALQSGEADPAAPRGSRAISRRGSTRAPS